MKRSILLTGVLGLVLASISAPAFAQGSRPGPVRNILTVFAPPSQQEQQQIAARVGMSAEQKSQMRTVNDRYRSDSANLRAKYDAAYQDVLDLMEATNPSKGQVNDTLRTFNNIHKEIVEREVGYWVDFKGILTPQQNQKFWNMFEQSRIRGNQGGGGQRR